ncbi:nuclear transport factor 2 family protein [Aquimarina sp. ERC-38]|uniref:SnoaL-like domain-containing protein n=1 Tax=Aquimarina sp. ERC-38 TaxID=2949996 RepID=UPI0022469A85|nr:SnoaL-like domain-containing protein [Aquimarina sp. ERC-38]UZO80804.1 nuclear transport factor 2 family protein [Aquimarina sp. ERC-38]
MNTKDIAKKLVDYCKNGKIEEAYKELYAEDAVSKEMEGVPNGVIKGKASHLEAFKEWQNSIIEVHEDYTSDPLVAYGYFAVRMMMDVTFKERGRQKFDEICLYKVVNDKITEAHFFYHIPM